MTGRLARRLLAAMVVVCGCSGAAFAGTATAATTTINVGSGQPGGEIPPAVMGSVYLYSFAGMDSFDSATNAFDPFFLSDLSNDVFTGSLRFPGGIESDFYQWKRAIGPQSERQDNAFGPNSGPSPSTVGPDEFGQLLDDTGASGVMTANFSTGSVQDAADEVDYMTGSADASGGGTFADQRAANGHAAPYNVPVWEVGNEEQNPANSWRTGTFLSFDGTSSDPDPPAASPCAGATAGTAGLADCEYIFGGITQFTGQPVVGFADRTGAAGVSNGQASQDFFVKYPPVDEQTDPVAVDVGGTQWTEVPSLRAVGNADDYTVDDATGKITFGDGTHGAIPPKGDAIAVSYDSGPHDGFNAYYAAMKAVNPSIQVCAADTDQNFITDMGSAFPYDCLQYHPYEQNTDTTGNIASFENTVMAAPRSENTTAQMWQSAMQSAAGHAIPLDLSEYGSLLNDTPDRGLVPYYYDSLDEALLNASQLAFWIKLGGINVADRQVLTGEQPAAANVAAGLPGAAPFATTGAIVTPPTITAGGADDTAVQPTGQYLELFKPLAGGTQLGTTTANNPQLPGTNITDLIVVAAENGGNVDTVVVNRSPTDSLAVNLNPDGALGQATVTTLNATNGGDALSTNLPGSTTPVTTTSATATVSGGSVALTIPAHSITLVQVAVAPPPAPPAATTPAPAPGRTPAVTPPRATPAKAKPKPVTISAIKLSGATVTWCKQCTYPKTKLTFKLTGEAGVRVALMVRNVVMVPEKGHAKKVKRVTWKQVAVVTLNGHKGLNTFKAGPRWHRHILAGTTMYVRVQLKQGKVWKTKKTLNLTVHRARNPRK